MAKHYDDTPELATGHDLPEVYNPNSPSNNHIIEQSSEVPLQEWSPLQSHASVPLPPVPPKPVSFLKQPSLSKQHSFSSSKHNESLYNRQTMDSAAASTLHHYAADPREPGSSYPAGSRGGGNGGVHRGGSRLVLILSILCAILGMAVVGLAAGTGVVASRYADTSVRLEQLSSSYSSLESHTKTAENPSSTASSAAPTATSFSEMTNGCSDSDEKTTGTTYTSKFLTRPSFTMFCNSDTVGGLTPLLSVFAGDFNMCMEACASWNNNIVVNNITADGCRGVSFIPNWFNMSEAVISKAPGNCYLKPAPLNRTSLSPPGGTVEVHSALLEGSRNEDEGDGGSGSRNKRDVPRPVDLF